ncbi:MAG: hypothetical protein NT004_07615 [Bacteroidetes bacterium]|nr:hypothetical protein [Bacteroidota bacterium]
MIILQVVFGLLGVFSLLIVLSAVRINKGQDNDYTNSSDYQDYQYKEDHKIKFAKEEIPAPVAKVSPRKPPVEDLSRMINMNRITKLIKQKQNEIAQLEMELAEVRENLMEPDFFN